MALMSGLVETRSDEMSGESKPSRLAEWMVRNAWGLVIGSSLVFWLAIVALFTLS